MKFKLVEDWDRLEEDLFSELRQFFGKTKDKTSNDRGTTRLHKRLIDKLFLHTPVGNDYYAIHHIDGIHSNSITDNEILLLQSHHNHIHSQVMKQLLSNNEIIEDSVRYKLGYKAKLAKANTVLKDLHEYMCAHANSLGIEAPKNDYEPINSLVEFDSSSYETLNDRTLVATIKEFLNEHDCVIIKVPFKKKHRYVITLLEYFQKDIPDEELKKIFVERNVKIV